MKKYILLLIPIVFAGILAYGWVLTNFMTSAPSKTRKEVLVEVPSGATLTQVARDLYKKKLITSVHKFKAITRLAKASEKIKAGEYKLHTRMSPVQILQILSKGQRIDYPITLQEGLNMYEIAQMFQDKGFGTKEEFLSLCRNKDFISRLLGELLNHSIDSLEGYLFPDTYRFVKNAGAEIVIKTMVKRFKSVYKSVHQTAHIKLPTHDHVILASMIEKETGAPEERGIISSVFHNRLKKGMRLQSDPTILYGILDQTGVMKKNITRTDIKAPTKYNTYTVQALPHGPIANPGQRSLEAAVHPDPTDYLYFVSRNNGTHVFSKTIKEHNKAVAKWQLSPKNRQGRSWRDLHKKKDQVRQKKDQNYKPKSQK